MSLPRNSFLARRTFAAFARPLLCEQRIAAHHEALARIVGRGDLGKVALIR